MPGQMLRHSLSIKMEHIQININELEKTGVDIIFPETKDQPGEDLMTSKFGVCEAGTENGHPSISFLARGADGKLYTLNTTAALFEGCYAALVGARIRFAELAKEKAKKAKGN